MREPLPLPQSIFISENGEPPAEPPLDRDELHRWAENYGHPEEWAKRAQQAHNRAENLFVEIRRQRERVLSELDDIASVLASPFAPHDIVPGNIDDALDRIQALIDDLTSA